MGDDSEVSGHPMVPQFCLFTSVVRKMLIFVTRFVPIVVMISSALVVFPMIVIVLVVPVVVSLRLPIIAGMLYIPIPIILVE